MISVKGLLRRDNPFDFIVLGFMMKLLGRIAGLFISYQIADAVFGFISWILIIKGFSLIPGRLRFPFTGSYRMLLKFYLFLCIIMIIRGYMIDYNYIWFTTVGAINYHLFQPTYIICYLMPFAALIPLRYFNFRIMLSYAEVIVLLNIVLLYVFRQEVMQASLYGAMGLEIEEDMITADSLSICSTFGFLALFYRFLPVTKWRIALLSIIITFVCMVVGARRGGTALFSLMLCGALYFYTSTKKGFIKWFIRLIVVLVVIVAIYYMTQSAMASFLMERGMEDTRTKVEEAMLSQMNTFELIFGKGLNGRYYCPLRDFDYLNGWRYIVETGFYNIVLKGGFLMAIVYCLLLFIPAYKGMFKSNNLFCKAAAFFIFYHLISLKPFGILSFDLSFLYLWMFMVCCMNNRVRAMSDEEIKQHFFYNV